MRKTITAFIACVILPTLVLAYFGFRSGEDLERRQVELLTTRARTALDRSAAGMRRALAASISDAERLLGTPRAPFLPENERPLFFLSAEGAVAAPAAPESRADEEKRLLRYSLADGFKKEFVEGDFIGAADAYAFFLSSLHTPSFRAQAVYHAARNLARGGETALAARLFEEVARAYAGVAGPDGEPLDVLALLGLWELGKVEKSAVAERLTRLRHALAPEWRAALYRRIGAAEAPADPAVAAACAAVAGLGCVPEAFALDGRLFLCRAIEGGPVFAATWIELACPAEDAGDGIAVAFEPSTGLLAAGQEAPARRPARDELCAEQLLSAHNVLLGVVAARSPFVAEIAAAARRQTAWMYGIVTALVVIAAAGGFFVLRAVRTEMRLARLKSDFIANVSHEMKTPVSTVRIFAELLADGGLAEDKVQAFAHILHAESERLSAIVENVLDFARIERGEIVLPVAPVDLGAVLGRVAEGFNARASREGVRFSAEVGAAGAIDSNGDAIACILQNLLDNAFKYRRGEAHEVALAVARDGRQVTIEVRDNGLGIPKDAQKRLFEKFYRAHPENDAPRGAGIGLALSRALARRLGGDIRLKRTSTAGSAFALVLPAGGGA